MKNQVQFGRYVLELSYFEVDQISSGSVPQISPYASCDDVGSQDKNRFVVE